ncbi:MAG TPA: phosphate acyltransferase PlsX [Ktedonobacterales bacterium]|nr:phosphate acyltransferase PlsX [Ktedonobacterales bacterium]
MSEADARAATTAAGAAVAPRAVRVALDAMGGDNAPGQIVRGGVEAAREQDVGVLLVGPEATLRAELTHYDTAGLDLTIVHADQVIGMDEHPAEAVRAKRRNSMTIALEQVRDGKAVAAVSAGNSGAMLAASLFTLRRIPGIERPALAGVFPAAGGRRTMVLDIGANTDSKPAYLVQFALMGSIYMEQVFGVANPRVGLLANGEEETKGDQLVREAHMLLKAVARSAGVNFIGNVEGRDVNAGTVDVVVCDGFVGNVVLKLAEGLSRMLQDTIKAAIKANPLTAVGGLLTLPAFARVRKTFDYEEYGGVPLLGLNGVSVVSHGRSGPKAIKSAIRVACQAAAANVPQLIAEGMARIAAQAATTTPAPAAPVAGAAPDASGGSGAGD